MPIKSFRGKIADEGTDRILLHTNNGSIGYRIVKFEVMTADAVGSIESANLVSIYKVEPTLAKINLGKADFADNTLLAAADYRQHDNEAYGLSANSIIFDNEVFNQDIYVTNKDLRTGASMNYYIELEQIKLDLNENTVATLKDIRNIDQQFDTTIN